MTPLRVPRRLESLADLGALPTDSEELRVRKAVLVLSSSLMTSLAFVWVGTYAALGLWVSAAIPLAYQLASAASIYTFARTRRYLLFRRSQLWMSLLLPFALQWSLGGFKASSAVSLWAFTSPLGALLFVGARQAVPWFLAFAALVGVSAGIDPALASGAPHIPNTVVVVFFGLNVLGVSTTAYVLLQYFVRARERAMAESERLLLNVLPEPVAARLKREQAIIADAHPAVTVLFADIVGFTPLSERLSPEDVVVLLDQVFARWDALAARYGVEKIKTIGDAYMVAGGIPVPRDDHAEAIAEMALAMLPAADAYMVVGGLPTPRADHLASVLELAIAMCDAISDVRTPHGEPLQLRIGIDAGPVVAGVIGRHKFSYDVWGDTVNTASRMESHAAPGTIQVSEDLYQRLRDHYDLRLRGTIDVKGKGPMTTYVLVGRTRRGDVENTLVAPTPG